MGILGVENLFGGEEPKKSKKRDKSQNTPEFNKKWRVRRAKAKKDSVNRKRNQRK